MIGGNSDIEEDFDDVPIPRAKVVMKKKPKVINSSDSDEEYKEAINPEKTPGAPISTRQTNPLSASDKIAELGLDKSDAAKKVPLDFDPETPGEKVETKKPTPGDDDNDSDDLF